MDGADSVKNEPVTITAPPQQVTIDPQNPLPEPNFFWRRLIAIFVCVTGMGLTWHNLEALHDLKDPHDLLALAKWTLAFTALVLTYYFVAPSASELTNMIQSAKIIRGSMLMASNPPASPEIPAAQRDSGPPPATDTPEALIAPVAPDSGDEEDAAPRGRS